MELLIGLAVVVGIVVLVVLFVVGIYNGLVSKRNRVRNAWSQIDVQLKRRHDLIPNLVNTVKGYLAHERAVLENVTRARSEAIAAGNDVAARAPAENALTRAVRSLFAVAEAYPDLKANQNMLALQEELSTTENRVAFARQHHNDSVLEYNTACQTLPNAFLAAPLGFTAEPLFELEDPGERAVPQVRL